MLTRRAILTAAALAVAGAAAAAPAAMPADMSMGSPKAKIEIIEYASLSCTHCAHFNETVFPALKARYIDTGKVRYTLKEMLTEPATVAAAGFMVARCAGPDRYFKVVDEVFRSQPRWESGKIKPILQEIAAANGLDEARFTACLKDEPAIKAIAERARRAQDEDGVDSTPTLFINGQRVDSVPQTPADMDAAIAAATRKGGR